MGSTFTLEFVVYLQVASSSPKNKSTKFLEKNVLLIGYPAPVDTKLTLRIEFNLCSTFVNSVTVVFPTPLRVIFVIPNPTFVFLFNSLITSKVIYFFLSSVITFPTVLRSA